MEQNKEVKKVEKVVGFFEGREYRVGDNQRYYAKIELKSDEYYRLDDLELGLIVGTTPWRPIPEQQKIALPNVRIWRLGNIYNGISVVKVSSSVPLYPSDFRITITNWAILGEKKEFRVNSLTDPFKIGQTPPDIQRARRLVIYRKDGNKEGTNLYRDATDGDGFPVGLWYDYNSDELTHEQFLELFDNFNICQQIPSAVQRLAHRLYCTSERNS